MTEAEAAINHHQQLVVDLIGPDLGVEESKMANEAIELFRRMATRWMEAKGIPRDAWEKHLMSEQQ